MSLRAVIVLLASAMGAGLSAIAEPQATFSPVSTTPTPPANPHRADQGDSPLLSPDRSPMWGKGQRLPAEFRESEFSDWEAYHLSPPPEGYRWVRVDRGAYRVNLQDGYIAEAIFGLPAN